MKNSKLTSLLLGITAVSAIVSILLLGASQAYVRQLAGLRNEAVLMQNSRPLIASLAAELNEYAKKNPSLDPILIAAGLKQGTAPVVKPPTK